MNPRITALILSAALVLALGAGAGFAKDASSAYVTTDTDCTDPDLQVNEVSDARDANVWLKLGSTDLEDLAYTLYRGGEIVWGGAFLLICETTDGKYTLADPLFADVADGTYTMKVYFQADHANFSGDSFRVESD